MPLVYRLTALPGPVDIGRRDVDRQRNTMFLDAEMDFDAVDLLAATTAAITTRLMVPIASSI
jgi:hypothetical protein